MVSVGIQTDISPAVCGEVVVEQREALVDKQCQTVLLSASTKHCPCNHPVADSRCNTIKLEPTWT